MTTTTSRTKLILLGTGSPALVPGKYQTSLAVVVDDTPYIVDCGAGTTQRLIDAREKYPAAFALPQLTRLFLTHLHPDHTVGLPSFLIAPWVRGRDVPISVFGPKGTDELVSGILKLYHIGIDELLHHGPFPRSPISLDLTEYQAGIIYQDERVEIEAFRVDHGNLETYGLKFVTPDKTIVFSADTCPVPILIEKAKGCDILVHEVYCEASIQGHPQRFQEYFPRVHTSAIALGKIARQIEPGLLVLTHQMTFELSDRELLAEIRQHYDGEVVSGQDLDVFE